MDSRLIDGTGKIITVIHLPGKRLAVFIYAVIYAIRLFAGFGTGHTL
jgi:hypothetical protein